MTIETYVQAQSRPGRLLIACALCVAVFICSVVLYLFVVSCAVSAYSCCIECCVRGVCLTWGESFLCVLLFVLVLVVVLILVVRAYSLLVLVVAAFINTATNTYFLTSIVWVGALWVFVVFVCRFVVCVYLFVLLSCTYLLFSVDL